MRLQNTTASPALRRTLGARIAAARHALGLSQSGLRVRLLTAYGLSVCARALSAWETGTALPKPRAWAPLREELGIDIGAALEAELSMKGNQSQCPQ